MSALRRLPQKCTSVYPLSYFLHGRFRSLSSLWGKEQGSEASNAREDPSSVNSVMHKRKSQYKKKIHVEKEESEIISTGNQTPLPPKLVTCENERNVNGKTETTDRRVLIKDLRRHLKGSKTKSRWYHLDQNIAEKFVRHLNKDLKEKDVIVESSPGPGVLTEILLTQTNNKVIAYEPHVILRANLEKYLLPRYPSSLQVYDLDLEKFYAHYIVDKKEPEKSMLEKFLSPMPVKGDRKVSPTRITGIILDIKFFFRLVLSFAFQCSFYEKIFPIFYLYIPEKMYNTIALNSENFVYRSVSVPFQFYFHIEYLDIVSREGFYPTHTPHSKGKYARDKCLYLIKISPNEEIFKKVPKEELLSFHYFINTLSRIKKTETFIMCLEKWIPDCGPQLIKNGFHVFAHPKDLTTEQLLLAYKIFISMPSYEESVFHYQWRQYAARYGEKDEEVPQLKLTEGISEMEDQELLES